MKTVLIFTLLCLFIPITAFAQEEDQCPQIVETALTITRENCESTERDEACYGHLVLQAEPQPGSADFNFEAPGDVVDIIEINSLNLSALNIEDGSWGVVMMEVQADLPDTADGNVTFLLFGDVGLNSAALLIPVMPSETLDIYDAPEGSILAQYPADEPLTVNGRLEEGDWLRLRVPEQLGGIGWIKAEDVTSDEDIMQLPVVSAEVSDPAVEFGPMQAFYFQSGQDDAPCEEAPNSGLLIQTPEGVANVTIWMDEVVIELDATAFVQAEPNGDLTVNVLEGTANITAMGVTQTASAGTQVSVPLDASLTAAAPPNPAQPIDPATIQSLPISLLPEPVAVPTAGTWNFSWGVEEMTCPDGTTVPFQTGQPNSSVQVVDNGEAIITLGARHLRTSVGVYSALYSDAQGNTYRSTLTVNSPSSMSGQARITMPTCTLTVPFTMSLGG